MQSKVVVDGVVDGAVVEGGLVEVESGAVVGVLSPGVVVGGGVVVHRSERTSVSQASLQNA